MNAEYTQQIIPVSARVQCTDGDGGSVTGLIVNPLACRLTHIVVQDYTVPPVEHLVPLALITATTHDTVTLGCTLDTLAVLDPLAEERYIRSTASEYEAFYAVDPFAEFEAEHIPLVTEHIAPDELAIQRGAQVVANDGRVGEVIALIVERPSGGIRFILVWLGHWLTRHEQAIPIAAVERIDSDTLYLKLTRDQVATLPILPLSSHYD